MSSEDVFLTAFMEEILQNEWENLSLGNNYQDMCFFELYATKYVKIGRLFTMGIGRQLKGHLFVTNSQDHINLEVFQEYARLYEDIRKTSIFVHFDPRWGFDNFFFLCVVSAKGIAESVIPLIDKYWIRPQWNRERGLGYLCLIDLEHKVAYMKIPHIVGAAYRKACDSLMKNINTALSKMNGKVVSPDIRSAGVQRRVLYYLKDHNYKVSTTETSLALNITVEEVDDAVKSLEAKGLIKIEPEQVKIEPKRIPKIRPTPPIIEHVEMSSGFEPYGEYLRIGIKIANESNMAILNCSVTLDSVPDALSFADPDKPYLELGNIMPNEFQSAIYKLKPTRCVDGDIRGTFNYFDASGQRHTLEIPSIHVRNICPFLTSDGVVLADWMDMLKGGLLDFRSECFEFKGSPKVAFTLAEDRVRHLKPIERDERVVDGVYCGYCCYFGNAKYGGYYFATTILVSGSETQGRLTLTVYSNHADIFTGYFHEVLEDVRKHVETAQGISVITGKCPECGGELDPSQADDKGIVKCTHCRCMNVIPPWMRTK